MEIQIRGEGGTGSYVRRNMNASMTRGSTTPRKDSYGVKSSGATT